MLTSNVLGPTLIALAIFGLLAVVFTKTIAARVLVVFGVGAALSENQWRAVLRQLVALGHVVAEGEFNTLTLTDHADWLELARQLGFGPEGCQQAMVFATEENPSRSIHPQCHRRFFNHRDKAVEVSSVKSHRNPACLCDSGRVFG